MPTVALHLRRALLALCLCTAAAHAQEMVSIAGSTVNMREGPTLDSTVLWELQRGYPLRVTERRGDWLAVRDFEDDTGWVARSLTSTEPYHIVKGKTLNMRKGPGTEHEVVAELAHGELLKTLDKQDEWVRVERYDGATGWVARRLVWGF